MEQVRRIVINGIKCFERKVKESRMEGGRRLHRTAGESSAGRMKKKLLGKSEWFKRAVWERLLQHHLQQKYAESRDAEVRVHGIDMARKTRRMTR